MHKRMIAAVFALALMATAASNATAGDRRTFAGKIKSVDAAKGTMVVTESKTNEELTVKLPPEKKIFIRRKGTEEDMQEGRGVEAYGKVAEDKSTVETSTLTVYTGRDRGGNTLKNAKRADGKLAREGDDWYVQTSDGKAKIVLSEKARRVTLEPATVADIAEGMSVYAYGTVKDGQATNLSILGLRK